MLAFAGKKLYISVLTLFGVSVIAFFLMRIVPGDNITDQLGRHYTPEKAMALREQLGLNKPVLVQYASWLGDAVQGDLGQSHAVRQPVTQAIASHLPVTLELTAIAMLFALGVGIPLGVIAAVKRNSVWDYLCSSLGVLGVSVPNFWLATLLILLLAYLLNWLPSGGFVPLSEDPVGNLKHMVLPGFALGAAVAAVIMRMTRAAMLEVLHQDYVRTARAKGLAPVKVIARHALKNALVPILTIAGIQAGYLLGGSVVIEMVFSLPGIGWLAYTAATQRDYFLLQAVILLIAAGFITINLLVDFIYGLADPRMRTQ